VLGPQSKYSCCYWGDGVCNLQQAQSDALALTTVRADIEDGMKVLDLGCGWMKA
jgi:cyclopropane-fatty-acyl-phospholipid synthase